MASLNSVFLNNSISFRYQFSICKKKEYPKEPLREEVTNVCDMPAEADIQLQMDYEKCESLAVRFFLIQQYDFNEQALTLATSGKQQNVSASLSP